MSEWKEYKKLEILDLCSGSGCITLALAKELPNSKIIGIDINKKAIELSLENKQYNQISNATFLESNLYEAVAGLKFDLIVSNPPYISEDDWKELDDEIKNWEDKNALVANNDGLAIYEKIIFHAQNFLNKKSILNSYDLPQLALEIDPKQIKPTINLLEECKFKKIDVIKDLTNKERLVIASI